MNRDDVLRIARDVGAAQPESLYGRTDYVVMTISELERFAALVAAAEREACAKVCESCWFIDGTDTANGFAAAIRARGQA